VRSTPAEVVAVELGRSLAQREGAPPAALRRCSPSSTPASASRATPWRWVGAARGHRDLAGEGRADADAQRLSGRGGAGAKPALAADLIYPARGIADHGAWLWPRWRATMAVECPSSWPPSATPGCSPPTASATRSSTNALLSASPSPARPTPSVAGERQGQAPTQPPPAAIDPNQRRSGSTAGGLTPPDALAARPSGQLSRSGRRGSRAELGIKRSTADGYPEDEADLS
jgi:hypothetical protein